MKRLFLKAAGAAAAGALLHACGGGGSDAGGSPPPTGTSTLLQRVEASSQHTLLRQALGRGGLTDLLSAGGTMTLFAPTDAAFEQLAGWIDMGSGAAMVAALSAQQWTNILRFHVTPQLYSASQIAVFARPGGNRPATLYDFRGDPAQLIFDDETGVVHIWDGIARASITLGQTDLAASNGVMHVVNDVLLPRGVLTVSQILRASIDTFSEFAESLTPALITQLDGAGPFTIFAPVNGRVGGAVSEAVFRRHIVGGEEIGVNDFSTTPTALTSLAGRALTLTKLNTGAPLATLRDGTTTAQVTDVDFFGSNGVVHNLDTVFR